MVRKVSSCLRFVLHQYRCLLFCPRCSRSATFPARATTNFSLLYRHTPDIRANPHVSLYTECSAIRCPHRGVVLSILVSRPRRAARSREEVLEVGDLPFVSNRSTSTYLDENHNEDNRQLSTATTTAASGALHYSISTSTASQLTTL